MTKSEKKYPRGLNDEELEMIDAVEGSDGYRKMAENYWSGKMTNRPINETILGTRGKAVVIESFGRT